MKKSRIRPAPRERRMVQAGDAMKRLIRRMGAERDMELVRLWRNWDEVLGEHLAPMARPLDHRGKTLVLGAYESIVLQELSYFSDTILDKVNTWLGREWFDTITFELINDRVPLDLPKR